MQAAQVSTHLDAPTLAGVLALIDEAERVDGYRPVSDQFWIDLDATADGARGHEAPIDGVIRVLIADPPNAIPIAYGQVARTGGSASIETVIRPDQRDQLGPIMDLIFAAVMPVTGSCELSWLVYAPTAAHDEVAQHFNLQPRRRLFQMRRPLPTGLAFTLVTRAFVPGRDDAAWLRVNQRAFAWNPDQGTWSHETLRSRFNEPWFDASGFLLHERDGRLAGFCWTKIHSDPALGEIYVIAVDPEFHGLGLGRALTLAGLDNLASRGITVGMLFVDADNTAAVSLYGALGFRVHRTDCMYQGQLDHHQDHDDHDQHERGTS
jgi:mycothiol synthase